MRLFKRKPESDNMHLPFMGLINLNTSVRGNTLQEVLQASDIVKNSCCGWLKFYDEISLDTELERIIYDIDDIYNVNTKPKRKRKNT